MNDIAKEEMIPFKQVPKWCGKNMGKRVHRSTIRRWMFRGVRGVKLETIMIHGKRFTSKEALLRFFTTTKESGSRSEVSSSKTQKQSARLRASEVNLESEEI